MSSSRRNFLSTMAAASISGWVTPTWAEEEKTDSKSKEVQPEKPVEKDYGLKVGVIGLKGRGQSHVNGHGIHVTAVCDCDRKVLEERAIAADERTGRSVQRFVDYRKMLDEADIDAVSIATPNHTHALIAIEACKAGKHVYLEKPVSHNVWEGRQIVNAARRYDRLVQAGTQSRSSTGIRDAVEFVRSGGLGSIQYAIGTCYKPRRSIGKLAQALKIPDHIDYDLWCGPAAKVDLYRPHVHYDWHWDFNTGNGDMGNQGIHQMDIARWFLGESKLSRRVMSVGGRVGYEDAGNTPNTQVVIHETSSAPLIFETRGLPRDKAAQEIWGAEEMDNYRGSRVGVIVQCENGYVVIPNYVQATAYDNDGIEIQHWQGAVNHFHNFLAAVADGDRSKLHADIEEGHLSSAYCHLGNISHQLGEAANWDQLQSLSSSNELLTDSFERLKSHLESNEVALDGLTVGPWLELDPDTERFVDSDKANDLLSREYRKPFVVEDMSESALVG